MNGIYLMDSEHFSNVYSKEDKEEIAKYISIEDKVFTKDDVMNHPSLLKDIEVIFSSWGAPKMDSAFLSLVPDLKAFFYGAGSIKHIVTDDFWKKDIIISSAWAANAIPVAEFTFAQIILSLKNMWKYNRTNRRIVCAGAYHSKVGIISLGMIGKLVAEKLKALDVSVFAYDPFISSETALSLNVTLVSLEEIFEICDVVSLHTPWLKETENMIRKEHFSLMKPNATFINTARGAVINENDLIDVLLKREDLTALLDVTHPEPPKETSPLFTMPNVFLTPHIAGSMDSECMRMGHFMVLEMKRWLNNEPLQYALTEQSAKRLA
ncbi:MAG: hydroxyacid dehydrogenase [Clostridia bacterium]|nr:hydroxyacid dehydrogenase [Clostridia bacterium]